MVAVAAAGCGGGDEKPTTPELVAQDFTFQPTEFPVGAGRQLTFTFTNDGQVVHNLSVPAIGVDFDLDAGGSETVILVPPATPGPVEFVCKFHQDRGMRGTFLVQP